MIGDRRYMLTIIDEFPVKYSGARNARIRVRCDCGTEVEFMKCWWKRRASCGCRPLKHVKQHPLYRRWANMKTRCTNPKAINYNLYGGRGIKVCDRWQSFEAFREDMEPTWKPGLTIERIDNDAGYTPENCRWATHAEQNRNQRNNVFVETPWGRMHIADAAAKSGINYITLHWRLKHGKPLFSPVQFQRKHLQT